MEGSGFMTCEKIDEGIEYIGEIIIFETERVLSMSRIINEVDFRFEPIHKIKL